jgi:1-acyl-sn-glycerol-3-phosphate acyltransferase
VDVDPRALPKMFDLLGEGRELLTPLERVQIRFIRRSLKPGPLDATLRACQRTLGQGWINASLSHLRHVHGLERLPRFEADQSYILVSNHRSFFDLYAITSFLVGQGLRHRLLFPVRANFFYDHPLGPLVNGAMSFFAMYPPIFRDPKRAALNLAGLDEVVRILEQGGTFVGLHPEGTRGKGDDPYELLPAQPGVGRIIQRSRATVIPVFINGLCNDIVEQVWTNFRRSGRDVNVVFGAPVAYDDLRARNGSPRVYREASERARDAIAALGREERALRSD